MLLHGHGGHLALVVLVGGKTVLVSSKVLQGRQGVNLGVNRYCTLGNLSCAEILSCVCVQNVLWSLVCACIKRTLANSDSLRTTYT